MASCILITHTQCLVMGLIQLVIMICVVSLHHWVKNDSRLYHCFTDRDVIRNYIGTGEVEQGAANIGRLTVYTGCCPNSDLHYLRHRHYFWECNYSILLLSIFISVKLWITIKSVSY